MDVDLVLDLTKVNFSPQQFSRTRQTVSSFLYSSGFVFL